MDKSSFYSTYLCEDSLALYSLSLYARVPYNCSKTHLNTKILITTPLGDKFIDTLSFPITVEGVESQQIECGIWNDYCWIYRRGVKLSLLGNWSFTIECEQPVDLPPQAIGIIVTKN